MNNADVLISLWRKPCNMLASDYHTSQSSSVHTVCIYLRTLCVCPPVFLPVCWFMPFFISLSLADPPFHISSHLFSKMRWKQKHKQMTRHVTRRNVNIISFFAGSVPQQKIQQICLYVSLCKFSFCCNSVARIEWKSSTSFFLFCFFGIFYVEKSGVVRKYYGLWNILYVGLPAQRKWCTVNSMLVLKIDEFIRHHQYYFPKTDSVTGF